MARFDDARMVSVLGRMALAVALLIVVLIPMGYGFTSIRGESRLLAFEAQLTASRAAKYIFFNERMWKYQKIKLSEVIELDAGMADRVLQRIVDNRGDVIVSNGARRGYFQISSSAPIVVHGVTLGRAETESSLDPILINIGNAALISLFLGLAVFVTMRTLPLRELRRVIANLEDAHREIAAQNRELEDKNWTLEQSEETLRRSEAVLKRRSDELVEAQRLGRIGDWSYRLGEPNLWWSPQLYELMGCPREFVTTRDAVLDMYVADGAARVISAQSETMQTGKSTSVDVKARRADGTVGDFVVLSRAMLDDAGRKIIGFSGTVQDISERKNAERQLERMAYYDPLTGLANRTLFNRKLDEVIAHFARSKAQAALLLLDLDRFKDVNDSLGHNSGDQLLTRVAHVMSRVVGNGRFLARLGGDEFAAIVSDFRDPAEIADLTRETIAALSEVFQLDRGEASIGVSIGIALIPRDGTSPADVQSNADLALYHAKAAGGGRAVFFEPDMGALAKHKLMLARDLNRAVADGAGLSVHYQPQVELATGKVTGFEALMRWKHPVLGNVPPSEFIAVAESSTLICDVGLWVLREAAMQARAWLDAGEQPRTVSVNVSAAQLWHTDLVADVARVLQETGLPPHLLCLELTESLLANHGEGVVRSVLVKLKELGVTLALDDFGTGYSSLGYLNELPFDKIKIDRVFVDGVGGSLRVRKLLEGIAALCHGLGMQIVAEGAETAEEVAVLRDLKCQVVQGFYFARPMPARDAIVVARLTDGLGDQSDGVAGHLAPLPAVPLVTSAA